MPNEPSEFLEGSLRCRRVRRVAEFWVYKDSMIVFLAKSMKMMLGRHRKRWFVSFLVCIFYKSYLMMFGSRDLDKNIYSKNRWIQALERDESHH